MKIVLYENKQIIEQLKKFEAYLVKETIRVKRLIKEGVQGLEDELGQFEESKKEVKALLRQLEYSIDIPTDRINWVLEYLNPMAEEWLHVEDDTIFFKGNAIDILLEGLDEGIKSFEQAEESTREAYSNSVSQPRDHYKEDPLQVQQKISEMKLEILRYFRNEFIRFSKNY